MVKENKTAPVNYKGVMVSSTFTDLKQHRAALIKAIDGQELKPVVMDNDSAKPDVDVLDSSLQMVHKASAYVGVISHKYGQIPECPKRNPDRLSLTELEFIEARRLQRPVLIFIMGGDHAVKRGDVETDPKAQPHPYAAASSMCPVAEVVRLLAPNSYESGYGRFKPAAA